MSADGTADPWSPEWSNAVFPVAERDRRWAKVRALMARDGIDVIACLPCTTNHDRGQADVRYLTQLGENSDEMVAAFPIEGEVTAWRSRPWRVPLPPTGFPIFVRRGAAWAGRASPPGCASGRGSRTARLPSPASRRRRSRISGRARARPTGTR